MALRLARNPPILAELRARLARNHGTAPLFDNGRLTKHLEAGYEIILDRHHAGVPPGDIEVPRLPDKQKAN